MCGICGIVDFSGTPDSRAVEEMNLTLRHRGPDAGGTHAFSTCVLGHRRLSIIDLSDSANQPMLSQDGTTAVVFNGEIYNFQEIRKSLESRGHRFRTRSDTEVLLELYLEKKEAMLDDLNGMFSFAIWDDREKRLLLARDRLGKKPLYYCHTDGRLSFSSELYSLLQDHAVPRGLSDQAVLEYLLYDFIPAPHSIFQGVCKLPRRTRRFLILRVSGHGSTGNRRLRKNRTTTRLKKQGCLSCFKTLCGCGSYQTCLWGLFSAAALIPH